MASAEAEPDADSPRTLHGKLAEQLLARIRSGEWPVGSTLPSDAQLVSETGVSRHTLRHTLRTLQESGFIERRQGAPSKVVSCTRPRVYSQNFNDLREMLSYPRHTFRENRIERHIECDAALLPMLKAPIGSPWYQIGAVRRDEHSRLPLAWTDIYIQARFARVAKMKNHHKEMVFEQIERHFGVAIDRAEISVEAGAISKAHAALLEAPAGSPALVVTRRYHDRHGDPFEVTVTVHPQDRFTFNMELKSVSRSSTIN